MLGLHARAKASSKDGAVGVLNIVVDFETRSRVSLKDTNAYKYARHPSTVVLCLGWATPNEISIWRPVKQGAVMGGACGGFPFEEDFGNILFHAFNAEFELEIWNNVCVTKYGWPELDPRQMSCLQARSSYCGLPRKLDTVMPVLGFQNLVKSDAGHKTMLRLTKPVRSKLVGCEYQGGKFDDDLKKHAHNEEYCRQDVRVERVLHNLCFPLREDERKLWLAHREINLRGVPVDTRLCDRAKYLVEDENIRLSAELYDLTGGQVEKPTQIQRLTKWIDSRGCAADLSIDGEKPSLREHVITAAVEKDIPADVKRALEIRLLSRNAAVAKYSAILNHADEDGYCRGAHIFYKAGTGRFAGAGVNFHNLYRLPKKEIPYGLELADRLSSDEPIENIQDELRKSDAGLIPTLGKFVRLSVRAPEGHLLGVSDYKSIEMRVLHWLAEDHTTINQIHDFDKGKGEEPYKLAAAAIFSKKVSDVTPEERQTGKVLILACGYMGGAETFINFCALYGIDMPRDRASELVQLYRRTYPKVRGLWYALGKAAVNAVKRRVRKQVGPVEFFMVGGTLNIRLPNGRRLMYYDAKIVQGMFGKEVEALDQRSGLRKAVGLPILCENIDQAVSRDLLADALLKCRAQGLEVILHVYDEIVIQFSEGQPEKLELLQEIMRDTPDWAKGLPVEAEGGASKRYTK